MYDAMYMKDYFHQGTNDTLIFFIHGIYSYPAQFEMFYPQLKKMGYSIFSILLKGHGDQLKNLTKIKYYEWVQQIEEQLIYFNDKYDKIYIIGHSMGGLLALDVKEHLITKRILIAPALRVKVSWKYIKLGLVIDNMNFDDSFTKSHRKVVGTIFPKQTVKRLSSAFSFFQLFKLIWYTDINLKDITKPILIIQSYQDECVSKKAPVKIMEHISSNDKEIIWLKKSYHATFDKNEENYMINKVIEYIKK